MAASVSAISILFGLNSAGFDRGMQGIMGRLGRIKGAITAAFAGVGTLGTIGWGIKLAAQAELAEAQMSVLLGSTAKARTMMDNLRKLDMDSPFDVEQLTEAAKRMLAYGISVEKVMPLLANLSEIAMGDAFKLDRLAYAIGQIGAAGKLMGQDMRQMTEAGFNPLLEISRLTGVHVDVLRQKMEAGGISADLVSLALQSATMETGRFHEANKTAGKVVAGQWAKLTTEAKALAKEVGEFLMPAVRDFIKVIRDGISWLRSWDASQLKLSATTATFGIALIGAMNIAARIPAIIKTIVVAMKAMAASQVLVQALSGPKGWAVVTTGLVVAGVATGLVVDQFKQFEDQLVETAAAAKDVASATDEIGKALPDEVLEIKKKMEAELGIGPGGKELADGTKAFAKAVQSLKPQALLQGSAEAQSVINDNRFSKPKIEAAAAAVIGIPGQLAKQARILDRIEQKPPFLREALI